ncbi:hypothetical protein M407DRAFT_30495 [Tulasnella calospora MUT 4182]|uniref:Uncharacterized protein n=1 Tax=Tulasnella calospora MUT 4182 TaxID=1051891 RepID=A0A0C3Q843_9AGAM|nr:hypothetical protein M407DRAFT_30495 [Tulasnella calospora MUT 4182]
MLSDPDKSLSRTFAGLTILRIVNEPATAITHGSTRIRTHIAPTSPIPVTYHLGNVVTLGVSTRIPNVQSLLEDFFDGILAEQYRHSIVSIAPHTLTKVTASLLHGFHSLTKSAHIVGDAAKNVSPTTPIPRTPSLTPNVSSAAGLRINPTSFTDLTLDSLRLACSLRNTVSHLGEKVTQAVVTVPVTSTTLASGHQGCQYLLSVDEGVLEVLATAGGPHLGAEDFDRPHHRLHGPTIHEARQLTSPRTTAASASSSVKSKRPSALSPLNPPTSRSNPSAAATTSSRLPPFQSARQRRLAQDPKARRAADMNEDLADTAPPGEHALTEDNDRLSKFDLDGIPPAPRRAPQIEVSCEIDANGILKVGAVQKGTGKSESIQRSI